MEEIRNCAKQLINNYSEEIEESIFKTCGNDVNMYAVNIVKVVENLKNPYVNECINNKIWHPKDIHVFEKDVLNPDKWQLLQDIRFPKNINKEKKKGVNRCKKCGSWYTLYSQAQTRSADEGFTTSVECQDCGFRYKFN